MGQCSSDSKDYKHSKGVLHGQSEITLLATSQIGVTLLHSAFLQH